MSGKIPSFITGANAKIKLDAKTLAYCQDCTYNVTTATIPIEAIGKYEPISNEPVAYFVDGTLSVIRYTSFAKAQNMSGAASDGNGPGKWTGNAGGNAGEHFDPARLLASQTFDIDIFQKTAGGDTTSVIKLKDCRFTRKGGSINKRGILVEQYAFVALLESEDTLATGNSGDSDLEA